MVRERQRKQKIKEKKKDRKTQAIALSGDGIWARHGTEAAETPRQQPEQVDTAALALAEERVSPADPDGTIAE